MPKYYCGSSKRKVCILIGVFEIIVHIVFAIILILFNLLPIILVFVILLTNIPFIIPMIIGAIKRHSDLLWPFILLKLLIVLSLIGGLGFCVLVVILVELHMIGHEDSFGVFFNFISLICSLIFVIMFVMNIIPLLIVRNYQKELIKIDNENFDVYYSDLRNIQQLQLQEDEEENPRQFMFIK